jgi:4-amino-4-deoxy-L-arabinose transferase-like glycosyltransferase
LTDTKTIRLERALLLLWFILNLGIGAFTVHEYGVSVDEPNNYRYATDTLDAYASFFGILYEPRYVLTYDGHGPAYVAIAGSLIRMIQRVFPNVFEPDLWHFSHFITFELTGLCIYWLTKRWFNRWTAWGILILFGTQPLLFGHAFINPKDIPFMFLFTLSLVFGFRLADSLEARESFVSLETPAKALINRFRETEPQRRRKFLIYAVLPLAASLALFAFAPQINSLIERFVTSFYTAKPDSWAGQIFNSITGDSSNISREEYVLQVLRLFRRAKRVLLIAVSFFSLAYFGLLMNNLTLSTFLQNTWKERYRLGEAFVDLAQFLRNSLTLVSLKIWFAEIFRALRNPRVLLTGVTLGLATGVRAIAPWAGVIVFLYLFTKVRSRAWTMAIAYFLVAGIVTYLAWPRLWDAPIPRYLEGLGVISNFPYPGLVLFDGHLHDSRELPRSYLPILMSIQFTEPLIVSVYVGLAVLGWQLLRRRLRTDLLLYIGLGFAFPLFELILLNSTLYNNFRQVLFLIPAMFMLAAATLELVFSKMTQSWARVLLIAAIALPGVFASVKLYPYEYVYYNSLVGGLPGASNRFEMDYWRISLREAAIELNEIASPGEIIIVTHSAGVFVRYVRPDLVVDKIIDSTLDLSKGYDYIVQVARWQRWDMYSEVKNIVSIERAGAVLATVKDVKLVSRK